MSQLIPVSSGSIGSHPCLVVDGRSLHGVLGVRRDFTTWMKNRIAKYQFVEGQHFEVFTNSGENSEGGRPSQEYTLEIGMGKELCMVENNDKGRIARRYFIECERRLFASSSHPPTLSRLSVRKDPERKELTAMINAWVNSSPIGYAAARTVINAYFGVKSVDDMTVDQVKSAIALVNRKIAEQPKALPESESNVILYGSPEFWVKELLGIHKEVLERTHEIERWMYSVNARVGQSTGPMFKQVTQELIKGTPVICTDRGIDLLHAERSNSLAAISDNLNRFAAHVWEAHWFADTLRLKVKRAQTMNP